MPGIDEADAALLRRMLEPDPERRFLDIDQVLRAMGGELVPAPLEPLPALSGGAFDVMVHHAGVGKLRAIKAVTARLGAPPPRFGWRARLVIDGKNRLAAGVSREAAEEIVALCANLGIASTVEPAKSRWRPIEWIAKHAAKFGLLAAAGPIGLLFWIIRGFIANGAIWHWPWSEWRELILFLIIFFLVPFVPIAGTLSLGSAPPLRDVPPGDPALRRLVTGIGRRVARLRDRFVRLPPAQRMLLTDLLHEAGELERVAVTLAARVAPASGADDVPEARTLPQGVSREKTASRLL